MGRDIQADPRDAMRETLAEGLTDAQCGEYISYSQRIRQIEHSDFVAREWQAHLDSLSSYAHWLAADVQGADLCGEMVSHHRRCATLCEREIEHRKRANKYPPHAGLVFRDFRAEREQIKERTIEIIESYLRKPLQRRGKELVGFCIFHDDRKYPSLRVNAEKKLWYCFTCGFGGDVFDFVARAEGRKQ